MSKKEIGKLGQIFVVFSHHLNRKSIIVNLTIFLLEFQVEEDLTEDEEIKETRFQKMSPVVDDISTPEEEDEAMKEIYERPSPSPTDSIG